jgi:hypothetical protein
MTDIRKRTCFVVGPIGDLESEARIHADWILEEIIQPVVTQFADFAVVRADQIAPPGMIDAQIIQQLLEAELVIADLSKENPNAFYEIGIRHMAQKPIIHMQLSDEKTPFDVSLYRTLKFSRARPSDLRKARGELKRAVEAVLSEGYKVDNPVTRARGQIKIEQEATPGERVVLEQIRSIQKRVEALEDGSLRATRTRSASLGTEVIVVEFSKSLDGDDRKNIPPRIFAIVRGILPEDSFLGARLANNELTIDISSGAMTDAAWKEIERSIKRLKIVRDVVHIPF